jgi:hypothetical protein
MTDEVASTSVDNNDQPVKKARYVREMSEPCQAEKDVTKTTNISCILDEVVEMDAILRWQNQQMAKAVFDNTVNSVIENMGFPLPDLENIMGNYGGNGDLEDEAVEMAIRSHGLQKPCSCPDIHVKPFPGIPFHRRHQYDASASHSSTKHLKEERSEFESDFLSEAVAVAIQKKGLGAFTQTDSR